MYYGREIVRETRRMGLFRAEVSETRSTDETAGNGFTALETYFASLRGFTIDSRNRETATAE